MDDAGHRLRGRELPRLLGQWLVAGVLPSWAVLTALAFEWTPASTAADPGVAARLGGALATSTSVLVVLLLLAVPAVVVAPLLRRPRRAGLDPEDVALLQAEIASTPIRVTLVQGGASAPAEAPRPRVPVRPPPEAVKPPSAAAVTPEPTSEPPPTRGDDDVDALFR